LWVAGFPIHDDENSLCVPDQSCCFPILLAPREVREAYLAAYLRQYDEEAQRACEARQMVNRMKVRFLARRLAMAWESK
jgi:hypothetical protein